MSTTVKATRIRPGLYRVNARGGVWTIKREADPYGEWTTWAVIGPDQRERYADTLAAAKALVARATA